MTQEELFQELRFVHGLDKKHGEHLLRRAEDYLAAHGFQWNRNRLIESNMAIQFLLLRCLSLELTLLADEHPTHPDLTDPALSGS